MCYRYSSTTTIILQFILLMNYATQGIKRTHTGVEKYATNALLVLKLRNSSMFISNSIATIKRRSALSCPSQDA